MPIACIALPNIESIADALRQGDSVVNFDSVVV